MDMLQGLLECRCGHSITAHSAAGCESMAAGCPCRETADAILEKALNAARQEPGQWTWDR